MVRRAAQRYDSARAVATPVQFGGANSVEIISTGSGIHRLQSIMMRGQFFPPGDIQWPLNLLYF